MFLVASLVMFVVFTANVTLGAATGNAFLSDVGEMLVLFAASVLFVAAILKREAAQKAKTGG
ncbi:hypothetical protein QKW60_09245 [Defluviimonas aestuarii]|jgi:hypothetical protein|uniref:hypothetical protein n=1 Tax=Albidovulum aestuarii TaxID=1130726 RepID=UPI00249A0907|nr:hypothetical protein [Defluviimonas aestuarii]MDI3336591.1 hypothetical protein [Defluviimonas aestuarii]